MLIVTCVLGGCCLFYEAVIWHWAFRQTKTVSASAEGRNEGTQIVGCKVALFCIQIKNVFLTIKHVLLFSVFRSINMIKLRGRFLRRDASQAKIYWLALIPRLRAAWDKSNLHKNANFEIGQLNHIESETTFPPRVSCTGRHRNRFDSVKVVAIGILQIRK